MYIPKHFNEVDQDAIDAFIQNNGFATLVSTENNSPVACHVPLTLSFANNERILTGHIACANPQWKIFQRQTDVLVIFSSPSAYISASWYNHFNVSTSNYIAIHVYGKIKIIEDYEVLREMLKTLINKHEPANGHKVKIEDYPQEYLRKEMQALVGFQISVEKTEANFKLSQNRSREEYENIISELKKSDEQGSAFIAGEMEKKLKK